VVEATTYTIPITLGEAQAISTCDPNPPPAGGGGSGTVMYDDATNQLSWNITYQNLSGPVIAAHFHGPATPQGTAGVQVTIPNSSPSIGNAVLTPTQEADFLAGLWYVNFHTAACGGGEIRGTVSGGGVGGETQLIDPASAATTTVSHNEAGGGLIAWLAAAIAAVSLAGGAGALVLGRRLLR
jgi:hypothetical protein